MGKQGRRSMGIHIGRREITALDPATGKSVCEPVGADHDPSELGQGLERLYRALGKPANHMQVAFSDDLLLFTAWPMPQLPRKRAELARLARWRLTKITANVEAYELGYQAAKADAGYLLLVCSVPVRLMNAIRDFVNDKALRWSVGDSTASFVFNHLKPELKEQAGALLVRSETNWTFLSWDAAGAVNLVKPGTLSSGEGNGPGEAVTEVIRLLHAMQNSVESSPTRRVMVWDIGGKPGELPGGFEPVVDIFRPGVARQPTSGRLAAELASYTR